MTTGNIDFEKSKYLSNATDACWWKVSMTWSSLKASPREKHNLTLYKHLFIFLFEV